VFRRGGNRSVSPPDAHLSRLVFTPAAAAGLGAPRLPLRNLTPGFADQSPVLPAVPAAALPRLRLPAFGGNPRENGAVEPRCPDETAPHHHPTPAEGERVCGEAFGGTTGFRGRKAFVEGKAELRPGSGLSREPSRRLLCRAAHACRLPTPLSAVRCPPSPESRDLARQNEIPLQSARPERFRSNIQEIISPELPIKCCLHNISFKYIAFSMC